jgi:hypothetical protein
VGLLDILGERERIGGPHKVQQMMRDLCALYGSRLGGTDIHTHIDLPRVGIDDLTIKALGERDGQVRLS